jgi:hypothetical protein
MDRKGTDNIGPLRHSVIYEGARDFNDFWVMLIKSFPEFENRHDLQVNKALPFCIIPLLPHQVEALRTKRFHVEPE